ncbi:MAG: hypothetical protein DMF66_07510 [Acidobacteria bacterium]|nr:MAG: hypothetical protein DMF66_07510 [Acidobacteriota bacterium]
MPDEYPTKIYRKSARKPNRYTMREVLLEREILPPSTYWAGYEERPGMADLKPLVRERDGDRCQICEKPVTADTSEVDHIRAVRRFRRPVDANELDNLWTLCKECHQWKTESDRRMESPLQGKLARRVRRGSGETHYPRTSRRALLLPNGNYGPETTPGNHQFIQGLLEHGLDLRPLQTKRTPKSERPTPECEAAVEAALAADDGGAGEGRGQAGVLRLVPAPGGARKPSAPDPDLKEILDDMRRRHKVQRERIERDPDGKDAA